MSTYTTSIYSTAKNLLQWNKKGGQGGTDTNACQTELFSDCLRNNGRVNAMWIPVELNGSNATVLSALKMTCDWGTKATWEAFVSGSLSPSLLSPSPPPSLLPLLSPFPPPSLLPPSSLSFLSLLLCVGEGEKESLIAGYINHFNLKPSVCYNLRVYQHKLL